MAGRWVAMGREGDPIGVRGGLWPGIVSSPRAWPWDALSGEGSLVLGRAIISVSITVTRSHARKGRGKL